MSIFKRAAKIVEANMADRREKERDPGEDLQAVYQQMITEVSGVKQLIGEVALAHERAAAEVAQLEKRMDDLEEEAKDALRNGDEDRARDRLNKRRQISEKLEAAKAKESVLRRKLQDVQDAYENLREQVHHFRDQRDDAEGRAYAAEARLAVQQARAATEHTGEQALAKLADGAAIAEAQTELHESVDEQLERLMRESGQA